MTHPRQAAQPNSTTEHGCKISALAQVASTSADLDCWRKSVHTILDQGNEKSNVCEVSLCSARSCVNVQLTERISIVNSFAAIFKKGVLEFFWKFYLVGQFLRHVSKHMWGCDCWLFGQRLVCHFLENSTPAFFPL